MANTFVQHGNVLTFTVPAGGVVNGKPYKIGSLVVVADGTFPEGSECEGHVVGVWEFDKEAADTPSQFDNAYLKAGETTITTVESGNTLIGVFTESQENGDLTCTVRLDGVSV